MATSTTDHQPAASGGASISVIMPAHNARAFLDRSLPPLIELRERGDVSEVIVADDGSTDGTPDAAATLGARVCRAEARQGQSAARNLGAAEAIGDILWFVDADVVVKSDGPAQIRHALSNPDITAIFGSYDDTPAAANFLSQYKNLVHHFRHHTSTPDVSTFWTGCGAIWRKAFLAAGGLDPQRTWLEDIEFGYRLKAAGRRILVIPQLQGTHLKVWKFPGLLKTEILGRAIPWAELTMQHQAADDLNIAFAERLRALIACLGALAILTGILGLTPLWLPGVFLLLAYVGNLDLLAFFRRRNGWAFAVAALLFHQVYYLYSSAAYAWVWLKSRRGRPAGQ